LHWASFFYAGEITVYTGAIDGQAASFLLTRQGQVQAKISLVCDSRPAIGVILPRHVLQFSEEF
jgi:hypothetical protein